MRPSHRHASSSSSWLWQRSFEDSSAAVNVRSLAIPRLKFLLKDEAVGASDGDEAVREGASRGVEGGEASQAWLHIVKDVKDVKVRGKAQEIRGLSSPITFTIHLKHSGETGDSNVFNSCRCLELSR